MSEITAVPLRPVSRAGVTTLWVGIGLFVVAGVAGAWAATQKPVMAAMPAPVFMKANAGRAGVKTTPSGLEYQILKAGAGPTPTTNDVAQIDYKGTLVNGTPFDATKPGQPATLPVGQVIPGFAEAMMLMPRGSRLRVWIPPELGYQNHEAGVIPPNSVLVFDLTMHDFAPMPPQMPQGAMPGADQAPQQ